MVVVTISPVIALFQHFSASFLIPWNRHGSSRIFLGGATWCEAPRRSISSAEGAAAGVGGRSPQRGVRGQSPLVGGLGGQSPPENFAFLEANNLTRKCLN